MLEIVIVVGIVGAALAFLVRHMVRSLRGGAGCARGGQLCHIDGSTDPPREQGEQADEQ